MLSINRVCGVIMSAAAGKLLGELNTRRCKKVEKKNF